MMKLDLIKYNSIDLLPDMSKGTYVLILSLERDKEIMIAGEDAEEISVSILRDM